MAQTGGIVMNALVPSSATSTRGCLRRTTLNPGSCSMSSFRRLHRRPGRQRGDRCGRRGGEGSLPAMEAGSMTDRDDSIERGKAEGRELEAAGWSPKGEEPKPSDAALPAAAGTPKTQAIEMQRKGERAEEEDRLLDEHGFERAPTEGANDSRERWVRRA